MKKSDIMAPVCKTDITMCITLYGTATETISILIYVQYKSCLLILKILEISRSCDCVLYKYLLLERGTL